MDLRQLTSFLCIVELKSFTSAARHLHIAQPALGHQIRKLEDALQVQLLLRHSRGVEPTDAGKALYAHARAILDRVKEARHAMLDYAGPPRGRVTLGLTPSISFMISTDLILACARDYPDLSLAVEEQLSAVLVEWVSDGRLDMCIANRPSVVHNVAFDSLFHEGIYLICREADMPGHDKTVTFAEVAEVSLIMPGLPHGLRKLMEDFADRSGLTLNIAFEVQSVSVVQDLVASGIGMTILPYGGARRSTEDAGLKALRIVDPEVRREIFLCTPERSALSPAVSEMRDLVRRVIQSHMADDAGSWTPN